jgi:hypothetical protein
MVVSIQNKIKLCILGNAITVLMVVIPVCILSESGQYFRFGPSDDFILINIRINTSEKYAAVLACIAVINVIKVISEEMGGPILGFNIYNPDKKNITDFTKCELQMYGNIMFLLSGIRGIFLTLITITQFDIALWSLGVSEVASVFTIHMLLNEKTFTPGYAVVATETEME